MAEEATCQEVVLIPKGGGEYRGIGIVEVVWKVVTVILNHQLTVSITCHDFLHGLWASRGTGTPTSEAKISSAVNSHEGGCPVHNIYGPAQGVWRLG